jgi:hypothetical protein
MDRKDTAEGNETTSPSRILLPFTDGVNSDALEYAVLLARNYHATLVPFSLMYVPQTARSVRLEHIQQSKDFLALVQAKAAKYGVSIEPHEVYTSDVIESIHCTMQAMSCRNIVLFVRDGNGVLLHTQEVKHILTQIPGQHHVIRLQRSGPHPLLKPLRRLSQMLTGRRKELITMETSFS